MSRRNNLIVLAKVIVGVSVGLLLLTISIKICPVIYIRTFGDSNGVSDMLSFLTAIMTVSALLVASLAFMFGVQRPKLKINKGRVMISNQQNQTCTEVSIEAAIENLGNVSAKYAVVEVRISKNLELKGIKQWNEIVSENEDIKYRRYVWAASSDLVIHPNMAIPIPIFHVSEVNYNSNSMGPKKVPIPLTIEYIFACDGFSRDTLTFNYEYHIY